MRNPGKAASRRSTAPAELRDARAARTSPGRPDHKRHPSPAGRSRPPGGSWRGHYPRFSELDGRHPIQRDIPEARIEYRARRRHGGRVLFFNFDLAREMGLVPSDHPNQLDPELREAILDTFSLVIINEFDLARGRRFPSADVKPGTYMATRYLQLQHRSRTGKTSGDGRGIWNGEFKGRGGITWDISSSGTGATRLSPAAACGNRLIETGDPRAAYGSGYNSVEDGLSAALMSEVFHRNGIPTERTLAIVAYPGGSAVNVRAGRNLLRPSHFFCQLRQGNLAGLRALVDHSIERRSGNGERPLPSRGRPESGESRYGEFARRAALDFSSAAARFESEYIFCWMAWDGDNILTDGGIIDYGSVRQFGLFHRDYRYDDVDRYSTRLCDQRLSARRIVQTFAQMRDFLIEGRKSPLRSYARDPLLDLFDENFERVSDELLLRRIGFSASDRARLMRERRGEVRRFREAFSHFERVQSRRGVHRVADGITSDAVFSMRDCLRELPRRYLRQLSRDASGGPWIEPAELIGLMRSEFALKADLRLTPSRERRIRELQESYLRLVESAARLPHDGESPTPQPVSIRRMLLRLTMASSLINRADRITGNGIIHVSSALLRSRPRLSPEELYAVFESFVERQILDPRMADPRSPVHRPRGRRQAAGRADPREPKVSRAVEKSIREVVKARQGL